MNITLQREQARVKAIRNAEMCEALAQNYAWWLTQIGDLTQEVPPQTSELIHQSTGKDLAARLMTARQLALAEARQSRENADRITSVLTAAANAKVPSGDAADPA